MRSVGHVARMEAVINTIFYLENLKGRDHTEHLEVDGRITLELNLMKKNGKLWNRCIWLRIGTSGGLLSTR
jgi:hypothetical protein